MNKVGKVAPGCEIQLPQGKKSWKINTLGFVDDKSNYVNSLKPKFSQELIETHDRNYCTISERGL